MIKNRNPATQTHTKKKKTKNEDVTSATRRPTPKFGHKKTHQITHTHTHTQISLFVFFVAIFFVVRALEAWLSKREESPRHAAYLEST
jgi:ABC-type sulfate transport system permease component